MKKQTKITFEQLFEEAKVMVKENKFNDFNFCVYVEFDLCGCTSVELQQNCYIDEIPDVDDDDEMCFTDFVNENKLEIFASGENLYDIIKNAFSQKEDVTNLDLIKALEHYKLYDCFIEL